MPVVAVIGAIALDAGAIGAVAAGTLTTLSAITAIGATVGAIGAVTGNKTLALVGGAFGLVGGIGTLASGAGIFDNTESLFGSSSAGAADTADAAAAAGGATDPGDAIAQAATTPSTVTPTDMPGAINAPPLAAQEGNAAAIETGGDATSPLGQALSPGATTTQDTASAAWTPPAQANALALPTAAQTATPDMMSSFDKMFNTSPDGTELTDTSSSSGGIFGWAKNNPLLSYGIIQAGGSFISGLTNPMTPAQIDALNSQADVNRATAALIQRETTNQGAALPSATVASAPVTGTPAPTNGLINSKPVGNALITGAPYAGPSTAPLLGGAAA